MEGYVLIDQPRQGADNMAIDQRMLEAVAQQSCLLLRVYRWSEPTLSLGYFQRLQERSRHTASRGLPVVRRSTGGGAIVHHYEWTYSLAVPPQRARHATSRAPAVGAAQSWYYAVHQAVVGWLSDLGVAARQWTTDCATEQPTSFAGQTPKKNSFLCFDRRSCGDVVVDLAKVMGSAQRRHASGAVLQHGSLLLACSPFAPELPGLQQMRASGDMQTRSVESDGGAISCVVSSNSNSDTRQHRSPALWDNSSMLSELSGSLVTAIEAMVQLPLHEVQQLEDLPLAPPSEASERFFSPAWTQRA